MLLDSERLFFFLAHGCHAALDAPKKAPSEAVDRATRVAWSAAGLRKNSPRLPCVLGALCDPGFEVDSSTPYQGLPALTTSLQGGRVALGTLFFLRPPFSDCPAPPDKFWESLRETTF